MPTNVGTNALLREDLGGIFLERQGETESIGLRVAPVHPSKQLRGEFNYFNEIGMLDEDLPNSPFTKKNPQAPASEGGLSIASNTYDIDRYAWGHRVITEIEEQEHTARPGSFSLEESYTRKYSRQAVKHHEKSVMSALSTAGNYASAHVEASPTDIRDAAAGDGHKDDIRAELDRLDKAGIDIEGLRLMVVMGPEVARKAAELNAVRDYTAIAVDGSDNQIRAGFAPRGALANFYMNAFEVPIELGISRVKTKSGGVYDYVMDDDIALVAVGTDMLDGSFLKTAARGEDEALGRIWTYDAANPKGTGIYVESLYSVFTPMPNSTFGSLLQGVLG